MQPYQGITEPSMTHHIKTKTRYIVFPFFLFGLIFALECQDCEQSSYSCQEASAQITSICMEGKFLTK